MPSVIRTKGESVMSIQMLKKLMQKNAPNYLTYKAVMLLGFFGFFRLASVVSPIVEKFDPTRLPLVRDIIFTTEGMQIILKYAKNVLAHDAFRIIHILSLGP